MTVGSGVLTLEQVQAEELAGRTWMFGGTTYRFADYAGPGEPPWESGSEGIAYPLLRQDGTPGAYAKFFDELKITEKRIERTRWLIDQRIDTWGAELRGAPRGWIDTREVGKPRGIGFDFICSLATAVPGRTWAMLRFDVKDGAVTLDDSFRRRCVEDLVRALTVLEQRDFVHGDLSRNNVIVDTNAASGEPALYLIDFDAFYAPTARGLSQLTVGQGGTFGTAGYCPPELERRAQQDVASAAPYSDRFARDMLLLEILCFDNECDEEDPAVRWPFEKIRSRLKECGALALVPYLASNSVFTLKEEERPSTRDVARMFQMPVPPRMKRRRSMAAPGRSTSWKEAGFETVLRAVVLVLWMLSAAHWGVVSFIAGEWLVNSPGAGLVGFAVRWMTTGGLFLAGLIGLSALTFAGREPMFVRIAGVVLRLPRRRNCERGEPAHLALLAGQLLGVLACLWLVVWLLIRSRGH